MKHFVLKLIVFVAIFLSIDIICGYILRNQRPIDFKLFLNSKVEFFKSSGVFDILIIGDSHVADALDPRIIENRSSLKTYNLGIYQSSPFENYYVTKAALEMLYTKPKIIVLGTNPTMFESSLSKGKYTPTILPMLNSFELVRNSQEGFDGSFFLNIIREKYLFKSIVKNLMGVKYKPRREIVDVYNGHLKFYNQQPETQWENFISDTKSTVNKEQVEYFTKTIELALENNIMVIIVHPPLWKENFDAISKGESYEKFKSIITDLTKKYDLITYYNYLEDEHIIKTLTFQKIDFLNTEHLNYYGCIKFTNSFCDYLNSDYVMKSQIQNPVANPPIRQ